MDERFKTEAEKADEDWIEKNPVVNKIQDRNLNVESNSVTPRISEPIPFEAKATKAETGVETSTPAQAQDTISRQVAEILETKPDMQMPDKGIESIGDELPEYTNKSAKEMIVEADNGIAEAQKISVAFKAAIDCFLKG